MGEESMNKKTQKETKNRTGGKLGDDLRNYDSNLGKRRRNRAMKISVD